MSLRPNGMGLSESATAAYLNVPAPLRVQHIEDTKAAGLGSRLTFDVPTKQTPSALSGTIDAFVKTCQRWHLSPQQQIILLGYDGSGFFGQQILDGRLLAPPQDVRERAGYVLAISIGLGSLFDESERAELEWLNAPRDVLNGRSPLAYMLEGRMANLMYVAMMVARERGL
jgi:Protein of unknown function (DUF2384)